MLRTLPLQKWRATPAKMRRYLLEAAFELLRARLIVAFTLKRAMPSLLTPTSGTQDGETARYVRHIITIATRALPYNSLCLPNAMAARRMLTRRGIASTLHLGVGYKEAHELHAHAWLEASGVVVTGESGTETVTRLPITEHNTLHNEGTL